MLGLDPDTNSSFGSLKWNAKRYTVMTEHLTDNQPFVDVYNMIQIGDNGKRRLDVYLSIPGWPLNEFGISNVIALVTDPSSPYELASFVTANVSRFATDVYKYLRYLAINNKDMPLNITLAGHSYGSSLCQVLALSFEYLLSDYDGNALADTKQFVEYLYDSFLSEYVITEIRVTDNLPVDASPSSHFASMVYDDLKARKADISNDDEIIKSIMVMDKQIFRNCIINGVYVFGAPTVFNGDMIGTYGEARSLRSSTSLEERTFSFMLTSDLFCGVLDTGTIIGKALSLFNKFKPRRHVGKIVYIPRSRWMIRHFLREDYIKEILQAYNTGEQLPIYSSNDYPLMPMIFLRALGLLFMSARPAPYIPETFVTIYFMAVDNLAIYVMSMAILTPLIYIIRMVLYSYKYFTVGVSNWMDILDMSIWW